MHVGIIVFEIKNLKPDELKGKRILEVGSCDTNGSTRPIMESFNPKEYIGCDIVDGPNVDKICDVANLINKFGKNSFDVVICNDMIEHVRDWKLAIHNLKGVCKEGGFIFISTVMKGFAFHSYPNDFWRYDQYDLQVIFDDFEVEAVQHISQGVFIKARKPKGFKETNLDQYKLYSIVADKRCVDVTEEDFQSSYFRKLVFKEKLIKKLLGIGEKFFSTI